MSAKIVDYDLRNPSRDYSALYEEIKSYAVWAHIAESTWIIKTDETCIQVRDKLLRVMDDDDRLFIASLSGEAAWHNVLCKNEFIQKHLASQC